MEEVVNGLVMETRFCIGRKCNISFKVDRNSSQIYHSSYCETHDKTSEQKKREWKKWIRLQSYESEKDGSEKKSESSQIQSSQKDIEKYSVKDTQEIKSSNEKDLQGTISPIKKGQIEEEQIQGEETVTEKTPTLGGDIKRVKDLSSIKLKLEEEKMIPQLDSTAQFSLTALDVSESMSLLNSSAEQMQQLMIKTGSSLDSLNRQISVRCAREVRETIRAKLEISKFVFRAASDKEKAQGDKHDH
jgi:hypothetical protein